MTQRVLFEPAWLLLAATVLAGCDSKSKDQTQADSQKKAVVAQADSQTPAPSTGKPAEGKNQPEDVAMVGSPSKEDSVVQVDARTLIADYAGNEQAADRKYKGRVLLVKGVVKSSTNYLDAVSLYNGTNLQAEVQCKVGVDGMKAITDHNRATWRREVKGKVKQINTGTTVVFQGTCKGLARKNAIVMDNCRVIEPVLLK